MAPKQLAALGKVLSHPARLRIIEIMEKHDRRSPNEISREYKEALGNISYHVKVLLDAGVVRLVDTVPRRGAVEHYYSLEKDSPILASIRGLAA